MTTRPRRRGAGHRWNETILEFFCLNKNYGELFFQ